MTNTVSTLSGLFKEVYADKLNVGRLESNFQIVSRKKTGTLNISGVGESDLKAMPGATHRR